MGGVKFIGALVPNGVCQAVGTFTLMELLLDVLAQLDLVGMVQEKLDFDRPAQSVQGPVGRVWIGVRIEGVEQTRSLDVVQLQGDDQACLSISQGYVTVIIRENMSIGKVPNFARLK